MTTYRLSFFLRAAIATSGLMLAAAPGWANHRAGWFPLPEVIAVGDFNEDGNLDMAVINTGFDNLSILLGDGKGGFKLEGIVQADTLPKDIQIADLNGDGHLDLVVSSSWGYDVQVLLGDGHGGFSPSKQIYGDEPWGIAIGDYNEDGHPDLAVSFNGAKTISYYSGDGSGQFTASPVAYTLSSGPGYVIAADLNHDKHLDLATVENINRLEVLLEMAPEASPRSPQL